MVWNLLFGSDIGLMSLFTIAFVIGMGAFFVALFMKKMREDEKK